jgi:chromate transporter
VWVTFVPCFLWIFLGAPYIEALRGQASLRAALSCISAAVVGVVLNLSVWLGLHILFHEVETLSLGPIRFAAPTIFSFDFVAGSLCLIAALMLFRFRLGVVRTLVLCAGLGLIARVAPGLA